MAFRGIRGHDLHTLSFERFRLFESLTLSKRRAAATECAELAPGGVRETRVSDSPEPSGVRMLARPGRHACHPHQRWAFSDCARRELCARLGGIDTGGIEKGTD